MLEFNKQWEASSWHEENTLRQWYADFLEDYQIGKLIPSTNADGKFCTYNKYGPEPAEVPTTVPQDYFYPCLVAWFTSDKGKEQKDNIVFKTKNDYTS